MYIRFAAYHVCIYLLGRSCSFETLSCFIFYYREVNFRKSDAEKVLAGLKSFFRLKYFSGKLPLSQKLRLLLWESFLTLHTVNGSPVLVTEYVTMLIQILG